MTDEATWYEKVTNQTFVLRHTCAVRLRELSVALTAVGNDALATKITNMAEMMALAAYHIECACNEKINSDLGFKKE